MALAVTVVLTAALLIVVGRQAIRLARDVAVITGGVLPAECNGDQPSSAIQSQVSLDFHKAQRRKNQAIAKNQRTLDQLPIYPRSTLTAQSDNFEGSGLLNIHGVCTYDVAAQGLGTDNYLTLAAEGWGTFRTYSLPRHTPAKPIYVFLRAGMKRRGWVFKRNDSSTSPPRTYLIFFAKRSRCVWFFLGYDQDGHPLNHDYTAATDLSGRALC